MACDAAEIFRSLEFYPNRKVRVVMEVSRHKCVVVSTVKKRNSSRDSSPKRELE